MEMEYRTQYHFKLYSAFIYKLCLLVVIFTYIIAFSLQCPKPSKKVISHIL